MESKEYKVDEISFTKLLEIPLRHKILVISLTIISTIIAAIILYFQPNIYKATSTLEISAKSANPNINDLITALSQNSQNIDTEIEIIKSHYVAKMALKNVDFINRYYYVNKYKTTEIYSKDAPFSAELKKGDGTKFTIYPKDDSKFILEAKKKGQEDFKTQAKFGEWIKGPYFEIKISKKGDFKYDKYIYEVSSLKEALKQIDSNLNVKQINPRASIILISFEDNVAKRAKEYVDSLASSYIKQSIERKTQEATKRIEFIDKQLKEIMKNLKYSEDKLANYKKKTNIINLSTKAKSLVESASKLESDLTKISLQRDVIQALYNQVSSGKGLESISIVGIGPDASSLIGMVQKLREAIIKKQMLLQEYTNAHPEVIKVTNEIVQLRRTILNSIRNMLKVLQEREAFIRDKLNKANRKISKLPKSEKILTNLQREFLVNEKIYSYLLEKRSEASIIKASTISSNRIIDKAELADKPVKPKKKLFIIGGAFIGLILGLILAYLIDLLSDKIESKEDIEKLTSISIVGVIPHWDKANGGVAVINEPKSAIAESFRTLRTNLQFMIKDESGVISINSTISGEGKTFVSVNLATIISMTEQKCIIINVDMRKPTLHERFNLSNHVGLSTYLSGKSLLYEIIQQSQFENLDVISSGPIPPNPSELINSKAFKELIERLKSVYDIIILDTPPVGLVADARLIMDISDVNLYILRESYSKKVFIKNINKLKDEGVKGLGIVYNDAKLDKESYGYGYYA